MKTTTRLATTKIVSASIALVALIAACDTTPKPKTVNDIVLTPKQLSVPITTYDIGNYSFQSVLVGNSIYFANYSNTAKTQFFVRYDVASNTFSSDLAKSSNVCGCGYMNRLISDGTNIFYIANDATKYTASSNAWTTLNYPATAKDNAGESGSLYYNGNIYFLGGRTPSTLFKSYSVASNAWTTSTNYLYATNSSQMVAYKNNIYAIGGTNIKNKLSVFSTTSNNWTALKDIPFDVSSSYDSSLTAILGNYLYLLQGTKIHIYDFANDLWATTPTTIAGVNGSSNLFSNGIKLYIAGKNASNIPQVHEVTVTQ